MEQIVFSLAYTSVRGNAIPRVVKLWNDRAQNKNLEWVIAVDEGDELSIKSAEACQQAVAVGDCAKLEVVVNKGRKDCVTGWNLAASKTTGKVIICVADDFLPPVNWDTLLLSLEPGWIDTDRVVHVNDGYVLNILVLAILTRARYDKFGYVFYGKYQSIFCDTEFGEVAYRDGVVLEAMHLMFEHCHPDCNKRPRDEIDLHHASQERWNSGEMLFNFRKKLGFPLDDGPKAKLQVPATSMVKESSKSDEYVVYMQLTRNDFCLVEVCRRMVEEGIHTFFWSEPDEYWSAEPIEPMFRFELAEAEQDLKARFGPQIDIHRRSFHVKDYRLPNDSRIDVETRVRNDSLAWIRGEGYQHIIIVDGDELWMRGTLEQVKKFVEQGHKAISTKMIPVIGLPGYPVEQATDVAVVYIGSGDFKCCRSPHQRQTIIQVSRIIHFSGTRRTLQETVDKHKRSGHYDDPDYLFEEWIEKVLPNIKPGFKHLWPNGIKGLHMYTKYQIWPNVRHWHPEELAEIPECIHTYLGK